MLGDSAVLEGRGGGAGGGSSGDAVVAATAASTAGGNPRDSTEAAEPAPAGGGVGSNSRGEEDSRRGEEAGDRSFGGNRWPRQETLALLKIRSDMDVAFRDASVKGPLWEEVSRSGYGMNSFRFSISFILLSSPFLISPCLIELLRLYNS